MDVCTGPHRPSRKPQVKRKLTRRAEVGCLQLQTMTDQPKMKAALRSRLCSKHVRRTAAASSPAKGCAEMLLVTNVHYHTSDSTASSSHG